MLALTFGGLTFSAPLAQTASSGIGQTLAAPVPLAALLTPDQVIALMNSGQLNDAEAEARKAAKAHPESARSRLLLARILAREGRLKEARQALAAAKALPQWEAQSLGVPFKSPRDIEIVMQSNPAEARALVADVLLAQGEDPKAYYLLALAWAMEEDWKAADQALQTAKRLDPQLSFAHPETLASLEKAIREQNTFTAPVPSGEPANAAARKGIPWWAWALGGGAAFFGWALWFGSKIEREQKAVIGEYQNKYQQELAAQKARAQTGDPTAQRHLERLSVLGEQMLDWQEDYLAQRISEAMLEAAYSKLHQAIQTDEGLAQYLAEQEAKKKAEQEAAEKVALEKKEREEARTSFRSKEDSDSWSSGDSSSSRDNSGGSEW